MKGGNGGRRPELRVRLNGGFPSLFVIRYSLFALSLSIFAILFKFLSGGLAKISDCGRIPSESIWFVYDQI